MFSYYGSKSKIVHLYPSPKYDKIIEPFAGSARYSLKWWDRDVTIVDKYEVIIKVWKWLQQASKGDVLGLPKLYKGQDIREFGLSEGETLFLSFMTGGGVATPRWTVSSFADYNQNQRRYHIIANNLHKIRHWKIIHCDYKSLRNNQATWFIDPPYQVGGQHYKHSNIDYVELSQWCQSRNGQVIVCENTKANWLKFWPMKNNQGAKNTNTTESIWSNLRTDYHVKQLSFL